MEWRNIKDCSNYQINENGEVRCLSRKAGSRIKEELYPLIMKQRLAKKGYPTVQIVRDDGSKFTAVIHRLVGLSFIPNPHNYPQIDHLDGNKLNNNVSNLEWVTNLENMKRSYKIGLRDESSKGEMNGRSKLKEDEVRYIYQNKDKFSTRYFSDKFNVSMSTVRDIKNNKKWVHITKFLK